MCRHFAVKENWVDLARASTSTARFFSYTCYTHTLKEREKWRRRTMDEKKIITIMCTHVSVVSTKAEFLSFDFLFAVLCGQKEASLYILYVYVGLIFFLFAFFSSSLHSSLTIHFFYFAFFHPSGLNYVIGNNVNRGSVGRYNRRIKSHNK